MGHNIGAAEVSIFERFFTESINMMCVAGIDGYFKRVNAAFDLLGYDAEELLSRPFLEFVHPDDCESTVAELAELAKGVPAINFENRYRCKDGSYKWLSWNTTPVHSGLLYAIVLDVTEAKHTEDSLRRVNHFLETIIDNIPSMVFIKDAKGLTFELFNRAGEELVGIPRQDLLGKNDFDLFPAAQAEFFQSKDRETLRGRVPVEVLEEPLETQRGRRWLHTIKVPILGASGTPEFLLGVSEDITERRLTQDALSQAVDTAKAANRELESFSYSVAHDLRGPLRILDATSKELVEQVAASGNTASLAQLGLIRNTVQQMAQLVDDLLALSRVTSSELRRERVNLSLLAEISIDRLRTANPQRTVEFVVEQDLHDEGDPRLLGILLDNLLSNAFKFTQKRRDARIEFARSNLEGRICYVVRDNGVGFDMAFADKLFGVFERLHSADEFEGSGVGLATVRRIVRRHHGHVCADGKVGIGAAFYFTLYSSF